MRISQTIGLVAGLLLLGGCTGIRPPRKAPYVDKTMVVTGYCRCGECCSWKRTWWGRPVFASGPNKGRKKIVGQTASGAMARRGTIAADTSRYPFGTIMYVDGYGYGRVEDRGGKIKGEHIDLFFNTHRQALKWGRQHRKVRIWKVPAGK